METSTIPASLALLMSFVLGYKAACPSDNWIERDGSCYLFQTTPVSHPTAELSCAEMEGHIASITDSDSAYFIKSSFPSQGDITNVWSRYLLLRDGSDVIVTDKVNNVTNCVGCNSLKSSVINQGLNLTCIVIGGITQISSNWNIADCYDNHQVICQKAAVFSSVLEVKDVAAIACLAFLVISFVIVITIDLIKNPVPDDNRQLIDDNRT